MGEWTYRLFASVMRDTVFIVKARPSLNFCCTVLNLPSVLLAHLIWPIQYSDGSSGETKRHDKLLPMRGLPSHRYSYSWTWACWTTTVHTPNTAVLLFNSRNEILASCAALPDGSAALLLLSAAFGSAGAAGESLRGCLRSHHGAPERRCDRESV